MLQIAICDRSPEYAAILEEMLHDAKDIAVCAVEHYQSMRDFLQRLEEPRAFDVVYIDVTFDPDMGLLLSRELSRKMPATQIVFTSCYVAHAVDIADAPHIYFLLKPYEKERVRAALKKVNDLFLETKDRRLLLPVRGNAAVVLPLSQIIYFERMRRTTVVNCCSENYEISLKIAELEELLPMPQFSRPHNSYLVNLSYVEKIERFCLHLNNGEVLPISNQRRPLFREALETFFKF